MSGIQENKLILGYDSFKELIESALGLKHYFFNGFLAMGAALTTFITSYVWNDANAVYFMLSLIGLDALTGIWKAIVNKTFSSSRLPRIAVISIIYVIMLSTSWNASVYSSLFIWLPGLVYGGLIGTLLVSIYENFAELGYLPKGLLYVIKNRLNGFYSKKNKPKDNKDNKDGDIWENN